ncbi:MAG TPA: Crp/Fnr family transcriptional regulator [Candidatus Saccharimonadales bacterium]|nr:Crp/Fnr family transcriptional regulator [Candidatus Saccharimonadales bacterium]
MQDIISHLNPYAAKRTFKKHSILLYQGEVPQVAYVMVSGVVKVYSINGSGEEQIVTFETPGDLFPSPWIFGKASHTLYYCEALSDCEVLQLPRRDLMAHIKSTPELQSSLLNYFAGRYTGLLMRITALEQSRAREKIMFTLYYLLFRYGHETRGGIFTVNIKLTHSVIAGLVGLTRETTTNELTKLKAEKVLRYSTHKYAIDKAKLERLLGEDSFNNISI